MFTTFSASVFPNSKPVSLKLIWAGKGFFRIIPYNGSQHILSTFEIGSNIHRLKVPNWTRRNVHGSFRNLLPVHGTTYNGYQPTWMMKCSGTLNRKIYGNDRHQTFKGSPGTGDPTTYSIYRWIGWDWYLSGDNPWDGSARSSSSRTMIRATEAGKKLTFQI